MSEKIWKCIDSVLRTVCYSQARKIAEHAESMFDNLRKVFPRVLINPSESFSLLQLRTIILGPYP